MWTSLFDLVQSPNLQQAGVALVIFASLLSGLGLIISRNLIRSVTHRHCVLLGVLYLVLAFPVVWASMPRSLAPSFQLSFLSPGSPVAAIATQANPLGQPANAMGEPESAADSQSPVAPNAVSNGELLLCALRAPEPSGVPGVTCDNSWAASPAREYSDSVSGATPDLTASLVPNPLPWQASSPQNTEPTRPIDFATIPAVSDSSSTITPTLSTISTGWLLSTGWSVLCGLFCGVWCLGAIVLLGRGFCGQLYWSRTIRLARAWQVPGPIRQSLLAKYQLKFLPRVFLTTRVPNAVSGGLFRPFILLHPNLIRELDESQLRDVLDHELAHYVRRDHWARWAEQFVVSLHWFNPIVHRLCRELAISREQLCDLRVLQDREPIHYGETLVRVAELTWASRSPWAGLPLGATSVLAPASELQRRLTAILAASPGPERRVSTGFVAVVVLALIGSGWVGSGLSLTPPATAAAIDEGSSVRSSEPRSLEEPIPASITEPPAAADRAIAGEQDSEAQQIRQRLLEWQTYFASEPDKFASLAQQYQMHYLNAWAAIDLDVALEVERMLSADHLSLRSGLLKHLIRAGRWETVFEILERDVDAESPLENALQMIANLSHRAAANDQAEVVQLANEKINRIGERLLEARRRRVAGLEESKPDQSEGYDYLNQGTLAQVAVAEFVGALANLRLLHNDNLELARSKESVSAEAVGKTSAAHTRALNNAQHALGKAPRILGTLLYGGEENFQRGTDLVALESWLAFAEQAQNDQEVALGLQFNIPIGRTRIPSSDRLSQQLTSLLPQMEVTWLVQDLPKADTAMATPWVHLKLHNGQWEIPLYYIATTPHRYWDRLRLVALMVRQMEPAQPEIARQLKQILLDHWSDPQATAAGPEQELARAEALLETSLTLLNDQDATPGVNFLQQGVVAWQSVLEQNLRETSDQVQAYEIESLAAAAILAARLPHDDLPEFVQKVLHRWSTAQIPVRTYHYRGMTRPVPGVDQHQLFTPSVYQEHWEFDRLVESQDWLPAARVCQRLALGNSAWKSSYRTIGIASCREHGLAETLKWTAELSDFEARLEIEMGAIQATEASEPPTELHPLRINDNVPLLVWPKTTLC